MFAYEPNTDESIDVEPRTRRALSESMSVVTLDGMPVESRDESIVLVVSHTGSTYHVDAREGRCTCPDSKHRQPENGCKHVRRARIALGKQPVDSQLLAAVDVNETLAANAPGPVVATSDGGIIDAGDDGEILDESDDTESDDERPDDCTCWNSALELPCWPCYRAGFDSQNPEEPATDDYVIVDGEPVKPERDE